MASLSMRFPGGKAKVVTLSYDDGVVEDRHLIEIMDKYGLKGTFNINAGLFAPPETNRQETTKGRLTQKEVVELYTNSGHEVAIHGLTHPFLEQIPANRASYEIIEDRRRLEELFGCTIRGMAYPYGTVGAVDHVVEIIKNAGILYARTTVSTENFSIPEDWLRLPATCHHANPRLMELTEKFLEAKVVFAPLMFYLWGHSYEFDRADNWDVIETFAQTIGGKDDIWYATNIEIFDYITAYKQLRFNVDMTIAENPTATDLYFSWGEKIYTVKAGESITIEKL